MIAPATTSTTRVWEHLLQTVGGPADRAPIAVTAARMEQGRQTLRVAGWDGVSRVLVVHPGAGGASKRWPVDGFASVVEPLDATLAVHQGPADTDAVRGFLDHVRCPPLRLIDPSLPTLAAVLSATTAYLGNDSGISHLAASVGTPSVILFTESARAWLPWSPTAHCLTVSTARVVETERAAIQTALSALL
jgi:ADP-heptose:LPS heptosyltransferase